MKNDYKMFENEKLDKIAAYTVLGISTSFGLIILIAPIVWTVCQFL